MLFSSLCIFWKKLSFTLCLNELILFVDFKSVDRLFHILGPKNRTQNCTCHAHNGCWKVFEQINTRGKNDELGAAKRGHVEAQIDGRCFQFLENREAFITRIITTLVFSKYFLVVVKNRREEASETEFPEKGPSTVLPSSAIRSISEECKEKMHKKK